MIKVPINFIVLSAYRIMWSLVMYDLPTGTKRERHSAIQFRNFLLDQGYEMTQFSAYMRYFFNKEELNAALKRIKDHLPEYGQVYFLQITDKQYQNSIKYHCRKKKREAKNPQQLYLF